MPAAFCTTSSTTTARHSSASGRPPSRSALSRAASPMVEKKTSSRMSRRPLANFTSTPAAPYRARVNAETASPPITGAGMFSRCSQYERR